MPELAELLLSEETVSGLLEIIVTVAVAAVAGVDAASVSLLVGAAGRFETTSASSEVIRVVDESQYQGGEGPCVEAIRTGQEVTFERASGRWPMFAAAASAAGMASVWSLPLQVRDRTTGALNLYSAGGAPPGDATVGIARGLAGQASAVLANAAALTSAQMANRQLQEALETRDMIGQAKGVLMARERMSADQAFDVLRRASQRSHRKLRDVAAEIVDHLGRPDREA